MGSISTFTGENKIFDGCGPDSDRLPDFQNRDLLGGNEVIERAKRDIQTSGTLLAGEKRGVR